MFETEPPSWKLEDFLKGWSQEKIQGTIEWKEKGNKEKIGESQMDEEEETIQTVNSKDEFER